MQNVVFTQLSIPEVRQLFKEELENYFRDNPIIEEKEQEQETYINKREAASILNCAVSTIDNYRRAGILKRYNLGSAVRFKKSDVIALVEKKQVA